MEQLVTVIVPVAETHLKYLPEALRSLTNQTVQVHKTIVVNDSGKSLRINAGTTVMNTRGKQGAAVARNLALERVNTPFVVFLDADDLMVNTAIETMLRAYASYREACYVYGDAWQTNGDGKVGYYVAPTYDRQLLIGERNIHNVTALVPTSIARKVGGFDEVIRGWEDWDFYIRLALAGYCGVKVPAPFILYRLNLGINRAYSGSIGDQLIRDVRERYHAYLEGTKPLMGCGCTDDEAKQIAQAFMRTLPPNQQDGAVLMEYLGKNQGEIPFRVNGRVYRGANSAESRFVRVQPPDVAGLLALQAFRLVPLSSETRMPSASDDVTQARKQVDPAQVTIPRMETAQQLASKTTVPDIEAFARELKKREPHTCAACGHIVNFHSEQGCQVLMPGDKPCGCPQFANEVKTEVKPDESKRSRSRKGSARRNARALPKTD